MDTESYLTCMDLLAKIDSLQSRLSECERERDDRAINFVKWIVNEIKDYRLRSYTNGTYIKDNTGDILTVEQVYTQFKQSLKSENNGNESNNV